MLEINLLPIREAKRKADQRQLAVLLAVTLAGSLALSVLHFMKVRSDLSTAQSSLSRTQAEIDRLKPQLEQVEAFKKKKAAIEHKLAVIEELDESRSGPVRVFDEIATHIPDRLWLTQFEHAENGIGIEGLSLDNELVAAFMTSLSASPFFQHVELESTEATDVGGFRLNEFRIRAQASMAAPSTVAAQSQN